MSQITTHVLDLSSGKPAAGLAVALEHQSQGDEWRQLARGTTDADGRIRDFLPPPTQHRLLAGTYRLTFQTAAYFGSRQIATFYPRVQIEFTIADAKAHHHVPLLLSPFGYSTYRGS